MDIRNTTRNDDNPIRPSLHMPMQAAPVQRAGQPGGGASAGGVEADFDWANLLGTAAKVAIPAISSAFGI